MIFGGAPQTVEPPIPLNREQVAARLREWYPEDLRTRGVGGAVLVVMDVDERGRVDNVRARGPRVLAIVPRPGPRVYHPVTGRAVRDLGWAREERLFRVAERAVAEARFIPGVTNGIAVPARRVRLVCYFAPEVGFQARAGVEATSVLTPV